MNPSPAIRVHDEVSLTGTRYGVAASWDRGGCDVDVDLQAVVVDERGMVTDAVYYNNLKAKGLTHSGDEVTGEKVGYDELVWVSLPKVPPSVRVIIFVVAAYSGGHLRNVHNGKLHLLEKDNDGEIGHFRMECSESNVDAVAMMVKADNGFWEFRVIEEPAMAGRHFIDILEPTIGNLIRSVIPGAPMKQKVAFAMEKGSVVDLPESADIKQIAAALGWDIAPGAGDDVDLDVSAVLFSGEGKKVGAVFFGNLKEFGLEHSGDNLTGEGDGDDEQITVFLEEVPANVEQIFFVVNIYSKGVTFEKVRNAYCRIIDPAGSELARYELKEGRGQAGLIISRLFRAPGDRWGFQALGKFCVGQTWKDSVPAMQPICRQKPRELQLRSATTQNSFVLGRQSTEVTSAQPPPPPSRACTIL